jgi:hypothetical protein
MGLFILLLLSVGGAGDQHLLSTDGLSWSGHGSSNASGDGGYGRLALRDSVPTVLHGGGGNAGTGLYRNNGTSGILWTKISDTDWNAHRPTGFEYSPDLGIWVAGNQKNTPGPIIKTSSDDGATWTLQTNAWSASAFSAIWDIAWSSTAGIFVACGDSAITPNFDSIQTSPDGVTWTSRDASGNGMNGGFAYCVIWSTILSKFIVVGSNISNTKSIGYSSDGITWSDVSTSPYNPGECLCLCEANGKIYFGGYNTSSIQHTVFSTTDLSTFTDENCPIDGQVDSLCYSPELGQLVAVGNRFTDSAHSIATATVASVASYPQFHHIVKLA